MIREIMPWELKNQYIKNEARSNFLQFLVFFKKKLNTIQSQKYHHANSNPNQLTTKSTSRLWTYETPMDEASWETNFGIYC